MKSFDPVLKRSVPDFDDYGNEDFLVKHLKIGYLNDFPRDILVRNDEDCHTDNFELDSLTSFLPTNTFDSIFGGPNLYRQGVDTVPHIQEAQESITQGLDSFLTPEKEPISFNFCDNGKASTTVTNNFSDKDPSIRIKIKANNIPRMTTFK